MGLAKKAMVFLCMLMTICGLSMSDVYKVGDSAGWTSIGPLDYKTWSATKTFHVGDTIVFDYNNQFHNVIRVTHKNFKACNATSPYTSFSSGNDSFTLKKAGHFYFICSFPGHCEAGQKVDIRVPRTPSPASTPGSAPVLAPTPGASSGPTLAPKNPDSTPTPTPGLGPNPPPSGQPLPSPSLSPSPATVHAPHNGGRSLNFSIFGLSVLVLGFFASGFVY